MGGLDRDAPLLRPRVRSNQPDLPDPHPFSQKRRHRRGDCHESFFTDHVLAGRKRLFDNCRSGRRKVGRARVLQRIFLRLTRLTLFLQAAYTRAEISKLRADLRQQHCDISRLTLAQVLSYNGIKPCFLGGRNSRLVWRYSNDCATRRRVSAGSITSSTSRRPAAT